MISLKKHIDGWVRSSDVSGLGKSPEPSRPALTAKQWAEQALQRLEANEREMKEIIDIMARAVQSLAERDERCARQVGDIAQRLRSVAGLMDLARIRQSILEGASSLTACVRQITQDGRESLLLVATKVEDYRSRLDKPENGLSHLTPPEPVAGTGVDPNWNPAAAQWVERASRRLGANRRELREIVFVIERAVESVTGRDERYDSEAGGIAQRLRSIAGLGNITDIRHGVIDNATLLTACVERIAEDSRESLRRLSEEVEGHRSRLEKPEELSSLDLVITNRCRLEEHLSARIKAEDRFCLILIALKDLKRVRDRFGGIAADDLLKQFALELRTQFPTAHLVARSCEDEFAVIIVTSCTNAEATVNRIRRTALGKYKVKSGEHFVIARIDAAIGVVEWDGAENSRDLLARGDNSVAEGTGSPHTQ